MIKKIKVIFEDDWVLVINKPAGLVVTNLGAKTGKTLENWLYKRGSRLKRAGIVHRLDKGTSGLMVVAKTEKSRISLKNQFASRRVKKKYLALVSGVTAGQGSIDMPIGRFAGDFRLCAVSEKGKKAMTSFKKIAEYKKDSSRHSLVKVKIKTGRTHQIRVHFSFLGWPLVGDVAYGGPENGLNRPFLEAIYLSFWHPQTKKSCVFKLKMSRELKEHLLGYEKI